MSWDATFRAARAHRPEKHSAVLGVSRAVTDTEMSWDELRWAETQLSGQLERTDRKNTPLELPWKLRLSSSQLISVSVTARLTPNTAECFFRSVRSSCPESCVSAHLSSSQLISVSVTARLTPNTAECFSGRCARAALKVASQLISARLSSSQCQLHLTQQSVFPVGALELPWKLRLSSSQLVSAHLSVNYT